MFSNTPLFGRNLRRTASDRAKPCRSQKVFRKVAFRDEPGMHRDDGDCPISRACLHGQSAYVLISLRKPPIQTGPLSGKIIGRSLLPPAGRNLHFVRESLTLSNEKVVLSGHSVTTPWMSTFWLNLLNASGAYPAPARSIPRLFVGTSQHQEAAAQRPASHPWVQTCRGLRRIG